MKKIAILIPTYKRANKLDKLINSFKYLKQSNIYFIINPKDKKTETFLKNIKNIKNINIFKTKGEYVEAINYGFLNTKEEFVFLGADDIEFSKDSEKKMLDVMKDKSIDITGGTDDWLISQSGVHTSHPLVRRSFAQTLEGGVVYHKEYIHYMCDLELLSLGKFKLADTTIPHNHYVNNKTNKDKTYQRSLKNLERDTRVYHKRNKGKYVLNALYNGVAILKQEKKLSIIVPVFNALEYFKQTIINIKEKTHYPFELIIIDDNSQKETRDYIKSLSKDKLGKCTRLVRIYNNYQRWCNANWNTGVKFAKNEYIAILNSDIQLSLNWDLYLLETLKKSIIACPYEINDHYKQPIKLDPEFEKRNLKAVKGCLFCFEKWASKFLFPIPKQLIHWCGDNYIAIKAEELANEINRKNKEIDEIDEIANFYQLDQTERQLNRLKSVSFNKMAVVYHSVTKSGKLIPNNLYSHLVIRDLLEYERLSGEDMQWLIDNMYSNLK